MTGSNAALSLYRELLRQTRSLPRWARRWPGVAARFAILFVGTCAKSFQGHSEVHAYYPTIVAGSIWSILGIVDGVRNRYL